MISIEIQHIKSFMNTLLREDVFNDFLVHHLELVTHYTVNIDGKIIVDEHTRDIEEDLAPTLEQYISWDTIRNDIFEMVKKHHRPQKLKIVFLMSTKTTENIITKVSGSKTHNSVTGFAINLYYEMHTLKLVTATNYSEFTLDKSFEQYFDDSIIKFLNKHGLE